MKLSRRENAVAVCVIDGMNLTGIAAVKLLFKKYISARGHAHFLHASLRVLAVNASCVASLCRHGMARDLWLLLMHELSKC